MRRGTPRHRSTERFQARAERCFTTCPQTLRSCCRGETAAARVRAPCHVECKRKSGRVVDLLHHSTTPSLDHFFRLYFARACRMSYSWLVSPGTYRRWAGGVLL